MKKLLGKVVTICLVTLVMVACSSTGSTSSDEALKLGVNLELTGEVAEYGLAELSGVELAIKLANKEKVFDKDIVLVKYDNTSNTAEAIAGVTKLATQDGVSGIIGPAVSSLSAAQFQAGNEFGVPMISPSATADGATLDANGKAYDFAFRACFLDSFQGTAMAIFAADNLKATKAIVIGDSSSDYALGLASNFTAKFESKGGKIVASEAYVAGDTDFNSILTKIAKLDYDVIYIPGYYNEVGLIIKQARDLGINVPILGGDGFDSPTLVELATAKALNNVYFTTAYTTVTDDADVAAFVEAYKAEYGAEPNMFAALGYDSANLLIAAAKQAGSTNPAEIQKALVNIKGFKGVTGTITFDELHNPIKSVLVVSLVDGVQFESIEVQP